MAGDNLDASETGEAQGCIHSLTLAGQNLPK